MSGHGLPETPVVVKRSRDESWPADEGVFYLISREGLFLCRRHRFFRSCAPARRWPAELARQEAFLEPRYPRLSRRLFERVIGFFAAVAERHAAEAAALLVWDESRGRAGVLVPRQEAETVRGRRGTPYATGVEYFPPTDLGPDLVVYGDVHSHVDYGARPSGTDIFDEDYRAGLHVIVGRISREPPEIHVEAVVDGERFPLGPADVIEGYEARRTDFPASWMDRVRVTVRSPIASSRETVGPGRGVGNGESRW